MKLCPACGIEYDDAERFCPKDGTPLRSREPASDLVGTVVANRYHVLRKLGAGGMGEVYLAEHLRMKRKSAVKVMHATMTGDADAVGRFHREASNACQIDHPNVAAIYDFGESDDGMIYLAMEYVEGESLAHLIATRGAVPLPRAADITRQVAEGLDAAHRLGIVHRDLKPDNILVGAHHDGRDRVKVVDFGISKAARGEGQTVTQSGNVVGTPAYMSPEQISGQQVDHRSDVYSLGIVAFNTLTGELPFQSPSAQAAMLMRLSQPSRRLEEARPDLTWPGSLQAALDRAMDTDVGRRFQSASEFASAVLASAGVPVAAREGGGPGDATTIVLGPSATPTTPDAPLTPANFSYPIPSGVTQAELSVLQSKLARSVGPIAKVLVRRAAVAAPSREALVAALAADIEDATERERFRRSAAATGAEP